MAVHKTFVAWFRPLDEHEETWTAPKFIIPEWKLAGLCNHHDPEYWYPETTGRLNYERMAKAICSECPVKNACLLAALEAEEDYGVWGGLNANDRRALLGKRLWNRKDAS